MHLYSIKIVSDVYYVRVAVTSATQQSRNDGIGVQHKQNCRGSERCASVFHFIIVA